MSVTSLSDKEVSVVAEKPIPVIAIRRAIAYSELYLEILNSRIEETIDDENQELHEAYKAQFNELAGAIRETKVWLNTQE